MDVFEKALLNIRPENKKIVKDFISYYKKICVENNTENYEGRELIRNLMVEKYQLKISRSLCSTILDGINGSYLHYAYLIIQDKDVIFITIGNSLEIEIIRTVEMEENNKIDIIIKKIITNKLLEHGPIIEVRKTIDLSKIRHKEDFIFKFSYLSNIVFKDSNMKEIFKNAKKDNNSYMDLLRKLLVDIKYNNSEKVNDIYQLPTYKKKSKNIQLILKNIDNMIHKQKND